MCWIEAPWCLGCFDLQDRTFCKSVGTRRKCDRTFAGMLSQNAAAGAKPTRSKALLRGPVFFHSRSSPGVSVETGANCRYTDGPMTTRGRSALTFFILRARGFSGLRRRLFFVPDVPYRCNADQLTGANYTINFVEFRDNGKPWCETELNDALAQIREARDQNAKTVVLVYIHGWKNNASEELSADVTKFRNEVDRISLILPRAEAGGKPPLIGIYLAWRGLTLTIEPFKTLSYWDRRGTARHVGQTGAYDATARIVAEGRQGSKQL